MNMVNGVSVPIAFLFAAALKTVLVNLVRNHEGRRKGNR